MSDETAAPYRELFVEAPAVKPRTEDDLLDQIRVAAFEADRLSVAINPGDFYALAVHLRARVENDRMSLFTERGCVSVVSDPDVAPGVVWPLPDSAVLQAAWTGEAP